MKGKYDRKASMIDRLKLLSLRQTLWRVAVEVGVRSVPQAIHVSAKSVSSGPSMMERDARRSDFSRFPEVCRQSSQLAWVPFTRTRECQEMGNRQTYMTSFLPPQWHSRGETWQVPRMTATPSSRCLDGKGCWGDTRRFH